MKILFITLEQSAKQNLKSILSDNFFIKNSKFIFTYGMKNENLIFKDITDIKIKSMMGYTKIIFNLNYLFKLRKNLNYIINKNNFSHVFFIDSFDFTKFYLKKFKDKKILYSQIIGPSVFLWKEKKADFINNEMSHIFSIFQIDRKFYKNNKYSYIGHPLFNKVIINKTSNTKIKKIGFFLGSRSQEVFMNISIILKLMDKLNNLKNFDYYFFSIPEFYNYTKKIFKGQNIFHILNNNDYYKYMSKLDFAFACSGTVHLELCFSRVPHFIFYKANLFNYYIFKTFIRTNYISLINIFNTKEIIKEFTQKNFNSSDLYNHFKFFYENSVQLHNYKSLMVSSLKKSNFSKLNTIPIIDYLKKSS